MINFPHYKWDLDIVLFFNQFCQKSLVLDTIALVFLSVDALRTAILVALIIGIWNYGKVRNDPDANKQVIFILFSILLTLSIIEILNALIQSPRPIVAYENLIQTPLTTNNTVELWRDGWARNSKHGSFPSDTVALLSAMASGIFFWKRRLGVLSILFVIFAGVLPRLYFGLHYFSDMFIGFLIALLSTFLINRASFFTRLSNILLSLDTRFPYGFGVLGFYLAYIISDKFILIRKLPLWLKSMFGNQ